jgi:hypothetical protein
VALADDLPISAPHYTDSRSETIQLVKVESDSWKAKAVASHHGSPRQERVKTPAKSVSNIETGTMSHAAGVSVRLKTFRLCDLNSIAVDGLCPAALGTTLSNDPLLDMVQERRRT